MNTIGREDNNEFEHPLAYGELDKRIIIYRSLSSNKAMMQINAWLLISGEFYKIYWLDPISNETMPKEQIYARTRMDFECPLDEWEAMDDEQALQWVMDAVQKEIDDDTVYGYTLVKR